MQIALDGALWWGDRALSTRLPVLPAEPGRALVMGLRPEHLSLPGSRWDSGEGQAAEIDAVVESVEPAGEQQIVWLDAHGQRLAARAEPELRVVVGVSLKLKLALSKARWFDRDSGAAISS